MIPKKRVCLQLLIVMLLASTGFSIAAKKRSKEDVVTQTKKSRDVKGDQTENLYQCFVNFYENGIDEKLYLQTDKPYYSAGEQIWFKGYLLNAITHTSLDITQYIYVELIESQGELASRVRVKRDSLGFNGYMKLDPKLEAGNYTLRAYTRWMTNKEDDGFFFTKNIKIVNPIIEAEASDNEPKRSRKSKGDTTTSTTKTALDYDLQFFPEGGMLLANTSQILAFKALAENGLSTSIKGTIFDSNNQEVGQLESTYNGMGSIYMVAKAGEQYYARVESEDGLTKEFQLPVVESIGTSIKVTRAEDKFLFQAYATDKSLLENSYIIIHSRGRIVAIKRGDSSAASSIAKDDLYDGVSVISLVSADHEVMAERLIFKSPTTHPTLDIEAGAENYGSRKLAKVRVKVSDSLGDPSTGEFGVSVTDNGSVELDPSKGDILSYLLLSSEIKGHIETPGLYFTENAEADAKNLDLLMLTQGWRRFDLKQVLSGVPEHHDLPYEKWSNIRGEVTGFFGNKAKNPKVLVLCSKLNVADIANIDESNKFNLFGLDMPDSTTYILQAMGRRGGSMLTLNIFDEKFPEVRAGVFDRDVLTSDVPTSFMNQSKEKFYHDGGLTNIEIDEVSVTTQKRETNSLSLFATESTSREDLEMMPGQTLDNLIYSYMGMSIADYEVTYRDSSSPVRFIVNGMDTEYNSIAMLTSDNIEQMEFYYGADAAVFLDSEGGVFCITLREGYEQGSDIQPTNIAFVNQLGYQSAAKFYQPSYDTPAVLKNSPLDYRTTIYWSGELQSDEDGYIDFNFYTADKATTYTITIEGVTTDGEICRGTTTMERTQID